MAVLFVAPVALVLTSLQYKQTVPTTVRSERLKATAVHQYRSTAVPQYRRDMVTPILQAARATRSTLLLSLCL